MRPTWALIDEAVQALGVAEGFANTVAQRRDGSDQRLARQASDAAKRAARLLALVEREDSEPELVK
jgi:hypothetical protein